MQVVLGTAEVVDAPVGPEAHGLLEHAAAVAALLADEDQRVVLHPERRVEPAERRARLVGEVAGRLGLAHGADAPRPVAAPPPVVGRDVDALAVDLEPAAPGPELREAAGVEEGAAVGVAVDVRRLLEGRHPALPGEVVGEAVLGARRACSAASCRPSITSTRNGPTDVSRRSRPSSREARTTRCSSPRRTSANASVTPRFGYWPMPEDEEQLVGARVAVEVVAVVEVAIAGAGLADGLRHLVDRAGRRAGDSIGS